MEFDRTTTAVAFVVLLAVLLGGTLTSGMPPAIAYPVSGGLVAFSALFLKARPSTALPAERALPAALTLRRSVTRGALGA